MNNPVQHHARRRLVRPSITDDAIDTLFREARTVVAFADQPVDRSVVEEIFESFKYGPTMMNNVPMRLTFVQSLEAREALVGFMNEGNKRKASTAPLLAIVSADRNSTRRCPPRSRTPRTPGRCSRTASSAATSPV